MNPKQNAAALKLKALHEGPGTFLIPNPWDPASARILASLGYPALATSSAAAANILGRPDGTISRDEALRQFAAIAAARRLPFPFMLVARAENFIRNRPDLADTIKRLQAYEQAGADVLFAPGLPSLAAIREVCASVSKPVNFVVGAKGRSFSVAELSQAGVKRISFGGSLHRAAMTGLLRAAEGAITKGTFDYVETTLPTAEFNRYFDN